MEIMILDPTQDPAQDNLLPPLHRYHAPHKSPPCFRKEIDDAGICWLTFDTPGSAANVWNADTLDELDQHIEELHRDSAVRALIIRSAKDRIFIAGADLKAVQNLRSDELRDLLMLGQDVFNHLESLRMPKVAAIHGACVGGGFEMALACDWRVASDSDATRIGLPETKIGLVPAWGGSTRLPRLLGLPRALDLIVRGKLLNARDAKRAGLIHEITAPENLFALAKRFALKQTRVKHHHFHFSQLWPVPQLLRFKAKSMLFAKFPWMRLELSAQVQAVEVITHGAQKSFDGSLALEQKAIANLTTAPGSCSFIETFLNKEAADKKLPLHLAKTPIRKITNAAVIGAGVMGSGIAFTLASKGVRVLMSDTSLDALAAGNGRLNGLLEGGIKRHALTHKLARDIHDRISLTNESVPLQRMDLVVEAVVEDMTVKKQLLSDLAKRCGDHTILATNTSALSLAEMAADVSHPERVIGLHFFNPAHLMPLVEVVALDHTSPEVTATALRFVQSIGKTPVLVKDRPGFVVNRILMPYLLGAVQLAETMRDPWKIDDAMMEFGMPMGPLRLLDEIGFDVALHVMGTLSRAFPDRLKPCPILEKLVDAGMLGKKNGSGFYLHNNDKSEPQANPNVLKHLLPKSLPSSRDHAAIAGQLVSLIRDEARRCLNEGVAASADDIKLAMILGTGFPPFRSLFSHETN